MAFHSEKSIVDLLQRNDGWSTHSSEEQARVEAIVTRNYNAYLRFMEDDSDVPLHRQKHLHYLKRGLRHLSDSYECLDASRPWLCYWILHSLELLDEPIPCEVATEVVGFLRRCQNPSGGFAGGPGQLPHLAPTYAAVCALSILGTEEAYDVIDRKRLYSFLMDCRTAEGAFIMHRDGEIDIRGAYCATVAARITHIMTPELFEGTAEWIAKCQTYEGGFGGEPGLEAHGGYSFCGYAALVILNKSTLVNVNKLLRWAACRQMKLEGGFQGRTNKLVDGCYSFWQGGIFPLLHNVLDVESKESLSAERWMFDQVALQDYLLINCQYQSGGLIDKPGKPRDFYHTCYCLSGMSVAQHFVNKDHTKLTVVGDKANLLKPVHPLYNICVDSAIHALRYFKALPAP